VFRLNQTDKVRVDQIQNAAERITGPFLHVRLDDSLKDWVIGYSSVRQGGCKQYREGCAPGPKPWIGWRVF
jgi:hypothetical protein